MTLSLTSHQHHDDGSTTLTVASTPSGLLDRLLRRKASTVAYRGSGTVRRRLAEVVNK